MMTWKYSVPRQIRAASCGAVLVAMAAGRPDVRAESTPERSAELFRATAAELDLDGDLYAYVETENVAADLMAKARELAGELADENEAAAGAAAAVERADGFLREAGLYDVAGIGLSSKPLGGGLYSVKSFLARRPAGAESCFWRMMGGAPRELPVLKTIPEEAALVVSADIRPADAWAFAQEAALKIGGAAAHARLRAAIDGAKANAGVDADALVASLTGEMAVSIQLSREATAQIPGGDDGIEILSPSLLVVLGVRDDALRRALLDHAKETGWPLEDVAIDGQTVHCGPAVPDAPIPLQPAFAQAGGWFLFASHVDAIAASIAASKTGGGLWSQPDFRRLADRLPRENNGITYVDERFNRVVMELQLATMTAQVPEGPESWGAALPARIVSWMPAGSSAQARIVKPHGISTWSVGPTGGKELAMTMAALPAGLMAAVAIPSFVRARAQAQESVLIDILGRVDAAKTQWALAHDKEDGAEVTEKDLAVHLRGGAVTLPPGHRLIVGPIGADPMIVRPNGTVVTPDMDE